MTAVTHLLNLRHAPHDVVGVRVVLRDLLNQRRRAVRLEETKGASLQTCEQTERERFIIYYVSSFVALSTWWPICFGKEIC